MTFHWKKLGKVFTPQEITDRPWLKEFAQAPCALVLEDRVRIYFSCRPPADAQGRYVSYSAWVDLDRQNLSRILAVAEQPILPLGNTGEFDEFGTYPVSVIRDADKIHAYYGGWTRCESVPFNVAIGMATSHDGGLTFQKAGAGPVLSYSPDEPFVLSGPKIRRFNGQWQLFYIAGQKWKMVDGRAEPVYKIRLATSQDGIHWQQHGHNLIENRIEDDEAQASPDVFYANGKFHMFFCYRYSSHYRGKDHGYRIGYASSSNLIHWQRDDSKAGIDISTQGWDAEMISYPHVFEVDGKIYLAYLGDQVGRYGFGLAELSGTLE